MPTTFGPWITPAPVTTSGPLPIDDSVFTRQLGRAASGFVAACETPDIVVRTNGLFMASGNGTTLPWFCGQIPMAVALDALDGLMSDYSPTLPPGAVGVDYDPAQPVGSAWVTSDITYTIPFRRYAESSPADAVDYPFTVRQVPASTLTQSNTWPPSGIADPGLWRPPDQANAWLSGTALSGLTALATIHMPTSYSVDSGGDFSADYTGIVVVSRGTYWTDTLGRQWAVVVLHFPQQISHVESGSYLIDNRLLPSATTTPTSDDYIEGVILTAAFTYQPRRYRFIRSVLPPLRQFPRDDFLGGAPRQGGTNGSTSIQGSARQGWRGAYR